MSRRTARATALLAAGVLSALGGVAYAVGPAVAATSAAVASPSSNPTCAPAAAALSFSDSLDKVVRDGVQLGGLSSLAWDARSRAWVSTLDNHGTDPARIWFFKDRAEPVVVRDPLVLRRPDGAPYDGTTSDNEGLAVLPDGDYLVSSETEPSIRIFGRDGVQKAELPVPARFDVTPAGEATSNATLEGLTITPDGRHIVAAMEGALSGDVSATGDATAHRFLIYSAGRNATWHLAKQVGYRAEAGQRIPEVAAYTNDSLLVEEATFSTTTGNTVQLYAVTGLKTSADISSASNLSSVPSSQLLHKKLVADLVTCPTLGATSKERQVNPLLDNFEGMAITGRAGHLFGVSLISDDNFSPTQVTRILNLVAVLP